VVARAGAGVILMHMRGTPDTMDGLAVYGHVAGEVAAELNVKQVGFAESEAGLVGYRLAPNFRALGPRFGRDAQAVAAALRQAPATLAAELAPRLRAGERVELAVEGLGMVELGPEEAAVVEEPVTGWRVVRDGATTVALDLEVSPELRLEGLARDLVRAVQDLRKSAGLDVADRIELAVKADGGGENQGENQGESGLHGVPTL